MAIFIHEYRDYPNAKNVKNGWWELRGCELYNSHGGHHTYRPHPMEVRIESTWQDIKTQIYTENPHGYKTGWLAPDGRFYGCDYMDHAECASWVFDAYETELEERGYCKIYIDYSCSKEYCYDPAPGGHSLTEAQLKHLLDNEIMTPAEYDKYMGLR